MLLCFHTYTLLRLRHLTLGIDIVLRDVSLGTKKEGFALLGSQCPYSESSPEETKVPKVISWSKGSNPLGM